MRIGAGLVLIAIGAILRFGISTVSTHGIAIHTVGDILIVVGIVGVVLMLLLWALWDRNRAPYRRDVPPEYRRDVPPDEMPPPRRYPADAPYEDEYRRPPYEDEYRR